MNNKIVTVLIKIGICIGANLLTKAICYGLEVSDYYTGFFVGMVTLTAIQSTELGDELFTNSK